MGLLSSYEEMELDANSSKTFRFVSHLTDSAVPVNMVTFSVFEAIVHGLST